MIEAAKDKEFTVRLTVIQSLGEQGPAAKEAIPALQVIADTENRQEIQRAALEALRKIEQKK